jgi:uncharacterized membrane-anchored protein YhcB (DUF1043 family)
MPPTTDETPDIQQQILTEVRFLKQQGEQFNQKFEQLRQTVEHFSQRVEQFDEKFENYQKATQWVVQLAFSLIAAATVTVIVSTVLGR